MENGTERHLPKNENAGGDLKRALARLINGKPTNPDLCRLVAEGRLRVSYSSVAKEAGRSRTLIAHKNCAYPEVRKAIGGAIKAKKEAADGSPSNDGSGATAYDVIQRLRAETAILRSEKAALATKVMEAIAVARRLEKKLDKERRRVDRVSRRSNRIVGRDVGDTGEIVPFPTD